MVFPMPDNATNWQQQKSNNPYPQSPPVNVAHTHILPYRPIPDRYIHAKRLQPGHISNYRTISCPKKPAELSSENPSNNPTVRSKTDTAINTQKKFRHRYPATKGTLPAVQKPGRYAGSGNREKRHPHPKAAPLPLRNKRQTSPKPFCPDKKCPLSVQSMRLAPNNPHPEPKNVPAYSRSRILPQQVSDYLQPYGRNVRKRPFPISRDFVPFPDYSRCIR